MISKLKIFFTKNLNRAYSLVNKVYGGDAGLTTVEELTECIQNVMVSAEILSELSGDEVPAREIAVFQRILNISLVLLYQHDIIHYFESSAYKNRKGALRGALYVETMQRNALTERQKKFPYQLEKSFHADRKKDFIRLINHLPVKTASVEPFKMIALNHILPLVLIQTVNFDKITMKLSEELIPEFLSLKAFLNTMGSTNSEWLGNFSLVQNINQTLRKIYCLDQNFSTVKKILLEEREKTIQLLKGNIYNQFDMLEEWEEVLNMLSTRNDKGLIKFITQIIRDRKESVEALREMSNELKEKQIWQNYYQIIQNSFVTSNAE